MRTIESDRVDDKTCRWCVVDTEQGKLTFEEVMSAWRSDQGFRSTWIGGLKALPFPACCWECPPVDETSLGRAFECVMIASPSLTRMRTDPGAFAEHFRPGCDVVTFGNLGGDAILVAPCPESHGEFAHLASFTATASPGRQDALWRTVGEALASRVGPRTLWLSTAGRGVAWLHVRLDASPKYYRHAEYVRA